MSILKELLDEVKKNPLDDQVRELCDKITEQEKENITKGYESFLKSSNIFLCLSGGKYFITLERDLPGKYSIGIWNDGKRIKSTEIKENNCRKILVEYAKQLKFMRGEM